MQRMTRALILGVPALLAIVLYLPALPGGFISDDFSLLLTFHGARDARELASQIAGMFVSGVNPPSNHYRPLSMLSFALSDVISGTHAPGWRWVNILLHGANAALVALLAALLLENDERSVRMSATAAATAAGLLFAAFPPSVEAVGWIAARADGIVLFFSLVSACAFVHSRRWSDGYGLLSLAAAVAAFLSKEAAAILPVLILALAWWKQPSDGGPGRAVVGAVLQAAPWLVIAAAYFMFRLWIFGDAFRVFPDSSPLRTFVSGEWLGTLASLAIWWPRALPETEARRVFGVALVLLAALAIVTGLRERPLGRLVFVSAFATAGAAGMLLLQFMWPPNGEGGRVLYELLAVAVTGLVVPLVARRSTWAAAAWLVVAVALVAEISMTRAAIDRRAQANRDMQALAGAVAAIVAEAPLGGYAFIVLPDHLGAIPFGRDSQAGLLLPPMQARSLAPQAIVQTTFELERWPDLFQRDIIGRLRRESLADVAANPLTPAMPPPHARPDRYFCFSRQSRMLVPLAMHFAPDLSDWTQQWRQALAGAGCADDEGAPLQSKA
jgi:hypothetical protein